MSKFIDAQNLVVEIWMERFDPFDCPPWAAEDVRRTLADNGGWIRNCFGYRRVFRDPDDYNRLKDALSTLPQSTVAWLMNAAMPKFHKLDTPGRIELLHQNHDEIIFQARKGADVRRCLLATKLIMESSFTIHDHLLYLPTEAKVGPAWGQMHGVPDA